MSLSQIKNPYRRGKYYWHRAPGPGGTITLSETALAEIVERSGLRDDVEFKERLRNCMSTGSIKVIPDG